MDSIADMLIRIKNGYLASHEMVELPFSKAKHALALILMKEGFVEEVKTVGKKEAMEIRLKYKDKIACLEGVKKISKPGLRVYIGKKKLAQLLRGQLGIAIISTPNGLMTTEEARKEGLGGELICRVW